MRFILAATAVLQLAGCAAGPHYNPRTFEKASSANPVDRGTEMLRQIRHAEIQRDEQRAVGTKKTPRLFRSQEDDKDGDEET